MPFSQTLPAIAPFKYVAGKLNEALQAVATQDAQIKKLAELLSSLTKTGTILSGKGSDFEKQKAALHNNLSISGETNIVVIVDNDYALSRSRHFMSG